MRSVKGWMRNPTLLGALGAVLAWLNAGVDLAGIDQQLYIPFIRRFAHPELYPGDFIFDNANYRATLYVPLIGWLHRLVGGDLLPLLAVVHTVTMFLFFTGVAAAARRSMRGPGPLWVVVLLSWPPPIAGAAAALWEPSPHPLTLAVALAACALACALSERALAAAILSALSTLVHPLEGAAAVVGCVLALAVGARDDLAARRRVGAFVVTAAALVGATRLVWSGQTVDLPLRPAAWWTAVATEPFLWITRWPAASFAALAAWMVLFAACCRSSNRASRRLVAFALGGGALTLIGVGGMLARSPLLVSLQLHRALYAFELATILLVARALSEAVVDGRLPPVLYVATAALSFTQALFVELAGLGAALAASRWAKHRRWVSWTLTALFVVFVGARLRPHHERTERDGDWIELQRWAARSTPLSARFLAPFHRPDFRVYSERPSVLGLQDQQPTIFDRSLAVTFVVRREAMAGYASRDCGALAAAARRFDAQYIVIEWDCALPLAHQQGDFRVYVSAMLSAP
jgi:hypothetical protein